MSGNSTNLICNRTILTRDQEMYFQNYTWWIETVGNLCCGSIGLFLNSVTIHVFSSASNFSKKTFFHRLLICLAIFDTLYIMCEISEVFRHRYKTFYQLEIFVNFVYPIRNIFMLSSVYMTVLLAFERYQAIANPVQYRLKSVKTKMNHQLLSYVMPGVVFTIIFYLPKFFELDVGEKHQCNDLRNETSLHINDSVDQVILKGIKEVCKVKYFLVPTKLRRNHIYVFWYIIVSNLTLTIILPMCVLTFLNCKIISSLMKFSERKHSLTSLNACTMKDLNCPNYGLRTFKPSTADRNKILILFLISILFAFSHSLRVVLNVDEFILRMNEMTKNQSCPSSRIWIRYVGPFNQLLIILNSSLNFFIYAFFDNGFQNVLKHRLKIDKNSPRCHVEDTEKSRSRSNTLALSTNVIELSCMKNDKICKP